jgi:hypothetical protein
LDRDEVGGAAGAETSQVGATAAPERGAPSLMTDHELTPDEYRTRWGLKSDYPMVAPAYAAQRRELAVKIGLGRKQEKKGSTAPGRKSGRKVSMKPRTKKTAA